MKKKLIVVGLFLLVLSLASIAVYAWTPCDYCGSPLTITYGKVVYDGEFCNCSNLPEDHTRYWKEVYDEYWCKSCGYYDQLNYKWIGLGCSYQ